jgi:hypothetical protein
MVLSTGAIKYVTAKNVLKLGLSNPYGQEYNLLVCDALAVDGWFPAVQRNIQHAFF